MFKINIFFAAAMDEEMEVDANPEENIASPDDHGDLAPSSQQPKKQLRLSYEEYRTMANVIVHHLRKKEAEDVRKQDVVNWYIEDLVGDIESQVSQIKFYFITDFYMKFCHQV